MRLRKILVVLFAGLPVAAWGQKIEVSAPNVVAVGERFKLEYRSTQQMGSIVDPAFGEMELLAGPSTARYISTEIINGNTVQQVTYYCTYVLRCSAEGTFTAGEFSAEIDGKRVTVRPVTIKAVNDVSQQQSAPVQSGSQAPQLASDDVIIRAIVDKTTLYKGEALRVTFKIYFRPQPQVEGGKMPTFNGFWSQELETQPQRQREALGGKIYTSQVLREYLLFPQQSGQLTIEPYSLDIVVQFRVRSSSTGDPFEDIMMGGSEVKEVRRKVASQAVTINVNALPEGAPTSFDGAVGEFSIAAEPLPTEIAANSAISRVIKIEGNGNIPQIQAPKIKLPDSFEQYSVKTTESVKTTARGVIGLRQFEYPFIARSEGEYIIPAVEFTYFNPRQARYVTLHAQQSIITITPDTMAGRSASAAIMGGVSKEDIKLLGKDIRFIELGAAGLVRRRGTIIGSGFYLLSLLLMGVVAGVLYFYLRRILSERRDKNIMKGKYANRVALRRLHQAEVYMNEGNQRKFYEEMLRGLWGYMADKCNIPVANLTKAAIREKAQKQGVPAALIESYIAIIGECEYGQYSPALSGRMGEEYRRAIEAITGMENKL